MITGNHAIDELSREYTRGSIRHIAFPQQDDIGKINDAHWFGRYQTGQDGVKVRKYKVGEWAIDAELLANAPQASVPGKIAGLLFSDIAKKSLVIIEYGGKQTSYSTGERLAGSNAVIVRIVKNKILLDENGYHATLTFKE